MQFSPLHQPVHFCQDRICGGVVKEAFPNKVAFIAPGEQLLLYVGREAVVACPGWDQVAGMACIEPGPGGLIREVFAGDGGYQWLMDIICLISRPVVGEAPVMQEVV